MRFVAIHVLACVAAACGHQSSRAAVFPTAVSHGRSEVCPDGVTPAYPNDPVVTKCGYEDAIGDGPTRLGGRVTGQGEGGLPGPGLSDMEVTVHEVERPTAAPGAGRQVARARTDAQGRFHLSAVLPAGEYDVVVRPEPGAAALTSTRLRLEGDRARRVEDIRLQVPSPEG